MSSAFGLRKNADYINHAYGTIVGETVVASSKPTREAIDTKPQTSDKQLATGQNKSAPTMKEPASAAKKQDVKEPVEKETEEVGGIL